MVHFNKDIQEELIKCTHCGTCRSICTTFAYKGKESYNSRGRIFLLEGLQERKIDFDEGIIDRIYSCSMCKACELLCPSSVKFTDMMKCVRNQLAAEHVGPLLNHEEMASLINDSGNIFGEPQRLVDLSPEVEKLPDKAPNLLYLGCTVSAFQPSLAKTTIKILREAGYNFTMMKEGEYCCSSFLDLVGLRQNYEAAMKTNLQRLNSLGVSNVVTLCPFCYGAFHEFSEKGESISSQHTTELLYDLMKKGKIDLKKSFDYTVTYFDPCHLGRYRGLYEVPRKLIKSVPGIEYVDMNRNREKSMCCGGTIRVPYYDTRSGMSEMIVKDAYESGAEYIITACPSCLHNLSTVSFEYDIEVMNIEDLIAYSMNI